MEALRYIPHYTLEDYQRWEGEWELIHALNIALSELNSVCKDCEVFYELDWIVSEDTVVRPDIMVVCGRFTDDFLRFPPALIVEILSPSTAIKDSTVKLDIYARNGVRHYIIMDSESSLVKTYVLEGNQYVEHFTDSFALADSCVLHVDFRALAA